MQQTADNRQQTAKNCRQAKPTGGFSVFFCVLCAVCCVLVNGCIHRSLTIKTDPPGATVYVNDQFRGESPVTYDFVWYGWHRVLVRKEGYERVEDRKELRAPIHFWIPADLVMELLPFTIRDVRTWSYALTPSAVPANPIPPALLQPENPERRRPSSTADQLPAAPPSVLPDAASTSDTRPPEPPSSTPSQEAPHESR